MEPKTQLFIIGLAAVLFTMYYLEKEMERRQIFWLYAVTGIAFAAISLQKVVKKEGSPEYYLTFAVLAILIAILYYDNETEAEGEPQKEETQGRRKPKRRKRKGK